MAILPERRAVSFPQAYIASLLRRILPTQTPRTFRLAPGVARRGVSNTRANFGTRSRHWLWRSKLHAPSGFWMDSERRAGPKCGRHRREPERRAFRSRRAERWGHGQDVEVLQ